MRHTFHLLISSCVLLLGGNPLYAATEKLDYLKYGSQTYSNVTVLRITDTDVFFSHGKGFANVKLKYLEPEFQKKFDYDPDAARQAERQQTRDDSLFQNVVASNIVAHAEKAHSTNAPEDNLVDSVSDKSIVGKPGPTLEGIKWLSEKPDLKGKYSLLYFWAPWSVPCRKATPELNLLQRRFPDNLAVIGLAAESQSEIGALTEPKLNFPSAMDPHGKLRLTLGINSIPCVLLLDPKGIVRYYGHPAAISEKQFQSLLPKAAAQAQ